MDVNIVNAEALRVGPDEVVIIRFKAGIDIAGQEMDDFMEQLERLGLKDRAVIFVGDVELAVVKQDGSGIPPDYADSAE